MLAVRRREIASSHWKGTAGPAVREGGGLQRPGHPGARRVERLDPRELGEGVVDLGRGRGALQSQQPQAVVRTRRGVAPRVLLRDLLEGGPRLLGVFLHLHPVATDLEERLAHGVRGREARDHDVEVVERLLVLALGAVGPAVLEEAAGLVVGGLLGEGGRAQDEEEQEEVREARHGYSFRPTTNAGRPPCTSTACSDRARRNPLDPRAGDEVVEAARELAALAGMPVHVQNDATAACGAELVFGTGERPKDFLYFYFGYFIGGGLVDERVRSYVGADYACSNALEGVRLCQQLMDARRAGDADGAGE